MSQKHTFSLDVFAIFSVAIGAWVIFGALYPFTFLPDYFAPDLGAQAIYEKFGGMDDDGDTGYFITVLVLPVITLGFALLSLAYTRLRHLPIRTSILALVFALVGFLPLVFLWVLEFS